MNQDHKKLHEKFATLGLERNRLTYELLSILPEIYDEGVYLKYKCATIYEYAGKYAGLSHSVVEKTLKLHKELEGKPCLREAIRMEGVHKVALVAKIATAETDEIFAEKVKDMSRPALIELSKELRQKVDVNRAAIEACSSSAVSQSMDDLINFSSNKCHAAQESLTISLDPDMQFLFLKLKKKFEKEVGVNLSNKQGLKLMLEALEETDDRTGNSARQWNEGVVKKFSGEKMDGGGKVLCDSVAKASVPMDDTDTEGEGEIAMCINRVRAGIKKIDSDLFKRYIPVKIRKMALVKTADRCAYPGCNRPYENFHHTVRFGNGGSHNSIVPVCRVHHEFAHGGVIKNEMARSEEWNFSLEGDKEKMEMICRLKARTRWQGHSA